MKKKLLRFLPVVMAIVTAVALCACGGTSTDDSPASGTASSRKDSNSVIVGISQELDSLDLQSAAYAGTREVLFNLYEGLVKATSGGDIEAAVASDYEISDDAKSITFTLRDGITFHDGSAVTAEDVVYSLDRYNEIQGEGSDFSNYKETVILDDNTLRVDLDEADAEFIYKLTCAIIPEANDGNIEENPIGTGPFKFKSYTAGESLVVEKYDGYWKDNCPYLDEVTFKIITNYESALMQLQAETIDVFQYLGDDDADTLDPSMYNILEGNVNYVQALFLNNACEPFDNILVRQALCHAVDRDYIDEMVSGSKSHIIGTNMIPAASAYYDSDLEYYYEYDPDKAKELLAEAGYPDGFSFEIMVPNNYAKHESVAEIIVDQLAAVGITATINLVDFNTWYSDAYVDRNYEATVVAVDGTLAPSSWFSKNISTASNNFTNYLNAEFDEVYVKAVNATTYEEKFEYYTRLQEILTEDAASVYIADPSNLLAINVELEGYEFYPIAAQDMSIVKYKD